jgi:hypothetical protein
MPSEIRSVGCPPWSLGLHVDLGEGDARVVVDGAMDELLTKPLATRASIALASAITGDAVTDTIDPAKLLDVEVDHLARTPALVATY